MCCSSTCTVSCSEHGSIWCGMHTGLSCMDQHQFLHASKRTASLRLSVTFGSFSSTLKHSNCLAAAKQVLQSPSLPRCSRYAAVVDGLCFLEGKGTVAAWLLSGAAMHAKALNQLQAPR